MVAVETLWWERELRKLSVSEECREQALHFVRDWSSGMPEADLDSFYHRKPIDRTPRCKIGEIRAVGQAYRLIFVYTPGHRNSDGEEVVYFVSVFRKTSDNNAAKIASAKKRAKQLCGWISKGQIV